MKIIYEYKNFRICEVEHTESFDAEDINNYILERYSAKRWRQIDFCYGLNSKLVARVLKEWKETIAQRTKPKAMLVTLTEGHGDISIKVNGVVIGIIRETTLDAINQTAVRKWARDNFEERVNKPVVHFFVETFARKRKLSEI